MEKAFLKYLNQLNLAPPLGSLAELNSLNSSQLLNIATQLPDEVLGTFLYLLKNEREPNQLFIKLMGMHEEENRSLSETFFKKAQLCYLEQPEELVNPLTTYLPLEALDDLAFLSSRENFFKRQNTVAINEYLLLLTGQETNYTPGQENEAFSFLWNWVLSTKSKPKNLPPTQNS